jgi:hypothetical protein
MQLPLTKVPTLQLLQKSGFPDIEHVAHDGSQGSQFAVALFQAIPEGQEQTPLVRVIEAKAQEEQP